jgi:hypothetical protein
MKKLLLIVLAFTAVKAFAQDPAYPPAPTAALNIVKAEYFVDIDPGFGNAVNIPVTAAVDIPALAASINTGALPAGAHKLCVRTLNAEGSWSITSVRQFIIDFDPAYPAAPAVPLNIVKAEYFIDADPGFGNAIDIPVAAATDIPAIVAGINTNLLLSGAHKLYVRTLNAEGEWSITSVRQFVVDGDPAYPAAPAVPLNIVKAEYFVDTDPGFGNAIDIPVAAATDIPAIVAGINTNLLLAGAHNLYVRTLNAEGSWSITSVRQFVVDDDPAYPAAPAAPGNITFAEYFFDTDPGFGNGTAITLTPRVDISNLTVPVNTGSLTAGQHFFYIRSFDDWGITSVRELQVNSALPLRFISFTVYAENNKAILKWKTDNETNTLSFDVERSVDGIHFEKIGEVFAANTAGLHEYMFNDNDPANAVNYYRLKQNDNDGKFTYSAVLRLTFGNNKQGLQVYPNPATNTISISSGVIAASKTVYIYNMLGAKILEQHFLNGQAIQVNVQALPRGTYKLIVSDGVKNEVTTFVKQ